jgi:hypothetical protein
MKFCSRLVHCSLVGILGLALAATPIFADPLGPNSVLFNPELGGPPDFTESSLALAHPSFSVLVASLTNPFVELATNPGINGSLTSNVWRDPSTSALAFEYMFSSTGPSSLIRSTMGGSVNLPWLGVNVLDVGADGSGSSTPAANSPNWSDGDPAFVTRDASSNGAGIAIQWRMVLEGTRLAGGDTSSNIWFVTNATDYRNISVGLQDSGAVSGVTGLGPVQPIPEPGTVLLTGIGLIGLCGMLRKKRRG